MERVNAYFGHRMIDDVRLVQGAIVGAAAARPGASAGSRGRSRRWPSARPRVEDPDLRAALTRLGARIATGRRGFAARHAGGARSSRDDRAGTSVARDNLLDPLPGDHVLGRPDAPNVLIDYASFTCPHCAHLHMRGACRPLKRDWIDTGKLKLIHRHFPADIVATRASLLAECAGPDGFFAARRRAVPDAGPVADRRRPVRRTDDRAGGAGGEPGAGAGLRRQ